MTEQELFMEAGYQTIKEVCTKLDKQKAVEESSNNELNFDDQVYDSTWFSLDSE